MSQGKLLQFKFHRNDHPYGDRFSSTARRLKAPALHGLKGRLIQIAIPCGALDLERLHSALFGNAYFEENSPCDPLPPGRLRIVGFYLIAAQGTSGDTRITAAATPDSPAAVTSPCASPGTCTAASSPATGRHWQAAVRG